MGHDAFVPVRSGSVFLLAMQQFSSFLICISFSLLAFQLISVVTPEIPAKAYLYVLWLIMKFMHDGSILYLINIGSAFLFGTAALQISATLEITASCGYSLYRGVGIPRLARR
ncbi:hypothetical protein BJX99DRAFT_170088 [Aspergillus californicus]